MKKTNRTIYLTVTLLLLSAIFYYIHYLIFNNLKDIFYWMIMNIAYVFIEVLLVTIIIHQMLNEREKKARLENMNIIIGTFYSEIGVKLLKYFIKSNKPDEIITKHMLVNSKWTERNFKSATRQLMKQNITIDINNIDLNSLKKFLHEEKQIIIRVMENPTLIEHEMFTELLLAVNHISEELNARDSVGNLTETDYNHLQKDINRGYKLLVMQWLQYIKYLKSSYPFLFSISLRTNPFDTNASAYVSE